MCPLTHTGAPAAPPKGAARVLLPGPAMDPLSRVALLLCLLFATTLPGCPGGPSWDEAFDASDDCALFSVWGSAPDDVWVVGGDAQAAQIFHFDGAWSEVEAPAVPLLAWVYGWGADDAVAVGLDGGMARWDGNTWESMDTGQTQDLWGVWGVGPDDFWVVGGTVGEAGPVLLHWDGDALVDVGLPPDANTRDITALFKVWGIGDRVFATGEAGQIVSWDGATWSAMAGGPRADQDFVSLWGTSPDAIVAVGGRGNARVAEFDGSAWSTIAPEGVGGLNGVFMDQEDMAVVGGISGFVGVYHPSTDELVAEDILGTEDLHAVWGDGEGRYYAVGGRLSEPFHGLAVVRTE